jgi:hypothetical protein
MNAQLTSIANASARLRIGFASVYSWRPHVEQLYFLATLAERAGHETFFLTCDADLPTCYTREIRERPGWRECLECRAGGLRSYPLRNVTALHSYAGSSGEGPEVPKEWAFSSASTLGRFESNSDYAGSEFAATAARLYPVVRASYAAARGWILRNRLDAVCVFNGRMDATRAIFEAAKSSGVRCLSVERTLFGDGLMLLPEENCLGLRSVHLLVSQWRQQPLNEFQAMRAVRHLAQRFLRTNIKEWRAYNTNAQTVPWPVADANRRILLVPSSRNEVWSHPDWTPEWPDPLDGYDAVIAALGLEPRDLLLRCHPNWGENIGKRGGRLSEEHYRQWARKRGIACIESNATVSTLGLIEQSDAIVVINGSAALEAGILGKQVIATAPSAYQEAGFRDSACTSAEVAKLRLDADLNATERAQRSRSIARQTLRFVHTMVYRVAQYTDYVKCETTTRYRYDLDAPPARFIDLLRSGQLAADDASFAADVAGEDDVLRLVRERNWTALCAAPKAPEHLVRLRRRLFLRPIDLISRWKPVGNR